MKGLPLTYSKDMQEDKEPTFDAVDSISLCIAAMTAMIAEMAVNISAMEDAAGRGYATATDLADWLVKELSLPFRQAHQVTAQIVRIAESRNIALEDVPLTEMQEIKPEINSGVLDVLSVRQSVESRTSLGGTAPQRVREAIDEARQRLAAT
jgi:argininosuccinate lyase